MKNRKDGFSWLGPLYLLFLFLFFPFPVLAQHSATTIFVGVCGTREDDTVVVNTQIIVTENPDSLGIIFAYTIDKCGLGNAFVVGVKNDTPTFVWTNRLQRLTIIFVEEKGTRSILTVK